MFVPVRFAAPVLAGALALLAGGARADASPAAVRWEREIAAFAAADRAQQPRGGGVLFVGSSSIRLWARLPQDFDQVAVVVNRGFGGSTMADLAALAKELVLPHRPAHVLVYAGDNDLAEGRTPQEILASFAQFVVTVRQALPDTRISFISVKPSPAREHLLPRARETNALLAGWLAGMANADFIDIFTPMLDAAGRPRGDLFLADRLHLNEAGYALWRAVIAGHLGAPAAPAVSSAGPASPPR